MYFCVENEYNIALYKQNIDKFCMIFFQGECNDFSDNFNRLSY